MHSFVDDQLIIFDLDGTLTDPASGLVKSFTYALERMGIDCSDKEALKRFIGPPLFSEWQRVYGFSEEQAHRALLFFREYFSVDGWCDNRLYEGIVPMLSALRAAGKTLALGTSKPQHFAMDILKLFALDGYFDLVAGALSETERDKKWEVIDYVLSCFPQIPKQRVLMVGDRRYDAEGAARCGIASVGVRWGHGSPAELEACSFCALVHTPEALTRLLTGQ